MSQERVSAQQFLFAINETLALLQNNLLQTVKRSHSFNSQIKSLNLQIEEKIRVINLDVEAANDIDTLKKLITEKMSSLNNDLKTKEQVEQKENSQLVQTIKEMASRVNELEHKTEQYQTRLAEQKFKNLQDYLTLLPNRSAFDERFTLEYNKFQRENNDLCLVIADIDRFKSINDSYGHSAGDKTLQTVAKALKNAIRVTDFIARYGGEEFVLIMPHSRLEQVLKPLEKLRITVKSIPFKFKQQPVSVTISFGVTQLKQGDSMAQAFDRADEALYEAKRQGRDRIVVK
jgi:diguanylate cyclase (GGDEF)-like protein